MTWNLTLDILLIVLILLFAPIGYMRGPVKELLVTLGVVFGALTVEFWARPWGRDLDFYFNTGDDAGAFIVAMSFLMGATFVCGYGMGLLIAPWTFSIRGRLLAALIAAINGALLVSFSLQYVRLFLLNDANEAALEESFAVDLLMNQVGWIMLGAILIVPIVIVYGLVTGRRAYDLRIWDDYADEEYYDGYDLDQDYLDDEFDPEPHQYPPAPVAMTDDSHMAETRVMPPRLPVSPAADDTSYKPEPEPIPFRIPEETRHVAVTESVEELRTDTAISAEELGGEWFAIGDTDPSLQSADTDALDRLAEAARDAEEMQAQVEDDGELPVGYARCENCHAVLPPSTGICPVCGHVH